jgi:hypothetical protein
MFDINQLKDTTRTSIAYIIISFTSAQIYRCLRTDATHKTGTDEITKQQPAR